MPLTHGYDCNFCKFTVEGNGEAILIVQHIINEHRELYDLVMKVNSLDDLIQKFADSGICRGFFSYTTKKRGYVKDYD